MVLNTVRPGRFLYRLEKNFFLQPDPVPIEQQAGNKRFFFGCKPHGVTDINKQLFSYMFKCINRLRSEFIVSNSNSMMLFVYFFENIGTKQVNTQ